jgi:hypothetical protein
MYKLCIVKPFPAEVNVKLELVAEKTRGMKEKMNDDKVTADVHECQPL